MKTLILTLSLLMASPMISESMAVPMHYFQTEISAKAEIFGIGKPKYNKRRIQRQNTPAKVFRRGKALQRKNGIGFITGKSIQHAA